MYRYKSSQILLWEMCWNFSLMPVHNLKKKFHSVYAFGNNLYIFGEFVV